MANPPYAGFPIGELVAEEIHGTFMLNCKFQIL